MSSYPRSKTTSNKFNENDIVSNSESAITIDLSSYVSKSFPVFDTSVYLTSTSKMIFGNGEVQESAFTNEQKQINADNKLKTTNVSFSNNTTEINGSLNLTSTSLMLSDEQIPISKITLLSDKLTEIDDNFNNIQSNDDDILELQNTSTVHTGRLDNHDSELLTLANETLSNTNSIQVNASSISNLNSSVAAIQVVDSAQDASISSLETLTTNHTANLSNIETDIASNVSQISATLASLNDYKTENDAALALSNTNMSQNTTDISSHGVRLDAVDVLNVTQTDSISSLELQINNNKIEQDTLELRVDDHDGLLTNLDVSTTANASSISDLQTGFASNSASISSLQTSNSQNTLNILANSTAISTKQPTVTSLNRLPASLIGNGDVSSEKLSLLNSMIVGNGSLQSQLNTINSTISGLDALQDLDLVNIPQLQNDVISLQTQANNQQNEITLLNSSKTTHDIQITNLTNQDVILQNNLNTSTTNIGNNLNSINVNSTAITALSNADIIHDGEIASIVAQNVLLQSNIDLKNNLINVSNKLNSDLLFDVAQNETLDNIISTIDNNIVALTADKQDNINGVNKLNSLYLDLSTTNLKYVDITEPLKAQISSITSAISTLQGLTSNDTISTFQDIEDNFDSLNLNKLDKSVYDDTVAPEIININNAISTLQSLQSGDVTSFNTINNNITNLTNTKQNIIDGTNKLNASLLNLDNNLVYADYPSSINNKMISLDLDIATKQNIIDGTNKLNASLLNLDNNLLYADYPSSINNKMTALDASISTLSATDVSQGILNTSLQTQINTNNTSISDLETFQTSQTSTNANLQSSLSDLETFETAQTSTNANLQSSISSLETFETAQTSTNANLQANLAAHTSAISELSPEWTVNNLFSDFVANMPALNESRPTMNFQINGEDYKVIQSSFFGFFDSGTQNLNTDTLSVQNLFDADHSSASYARLGYQNNWWVDDNDVLVRYTTAQYDGSGTYVGGLSQLDIDSNAYAGEFIEIQTPKYFTPTEVVFYAVNTIQMPITVHLLGSNNNTDYELIQSLTNTASLSVSHTISNASKFKTFKFVFAQAGTHPGIALTGITLAGTGSNSLFSSVEKIASLETFQSEQETLNSTNATAITTLQTNIDNNSTALTALQNADITLQTNIDNNSTDITSLQNADITLQTNIDNIDLSSKLDVVAYQPPKIDTISSGGTFASDVLTYDYDESTIFMNQLSSNNVFGLSLNILSPANNKTYKQKIIIDCLQYKGYVNALTINTEAVEIKYLNGDIGINLAPISGYSNILQTLEITRINDTWFCLSKLQLFYNSASNVPYFDSLELPVITLNGSASITLEINGGAYSEQGATAVDAASVDLSNDIIVSGDTVNVTTLGVYQIHFDVVDARGNNAVRKTRVITVLDSTNPVVVLVGDAEMTIAPNSTWTDLGASASDNSNESLTVVVSGDTVNTAIVGDYTILYTATDSSGNSHQISRLVHVSDPYTLEWSNSSTDIFSLLNFYSNLPYFGNSTSSTFTLSGNNNYQDGAYTVYDCWSHAGTTTHDSRNIFQLAGIFAQQDYGTTNSYTVKDFGATVIQPPLSQRPYPNALPYTGAYDSNGFHVFFTQTDTNSGVHNGIYHEIDFPFYVEVSNLTLVFNSSTQVMTYVLLGSNDDGATYDFIFEKDTLVTGNATQSNPISTTLKYKRFKLIYTSFNGTVNNIYFKQIKLFGDIYSI